jgi:single-strand DNA-binding protein
MSSLNKAQLIGRIGKDPESKQVGNSTVTNFSIATSEKYKDKNGEQVENTQWHNIVAWGRLAEVCRDYLKKGSLVYVEGKIETRSWEKDGEKRYSTEIKALQMTMLDSKSDNYQGGAPKNPQNNSQSSPVELGKDFDDGQDLPF